MGERIQEIIILEGDASPSLLTPRHAALSCRPRPTFTSGQLYLMLLDLFLAESDGTKVWPAFMASLSPQVR